MDLYGKSLLVRFFNRALDVYNRHRYKMPPEILITDELSSMTEDLPEDI